MSVGGVVIVTHRMDMPTVSPEKVARGPVPLPHHVLTIVVAFDYQCVLTFTFGEMAAVQPNGGGHGVQ